MTRKTDKGQVYTEAAQPGSRAARKIWDALRKQGFKQFRFWYEPIGPALEMAGHSGGWMLVAIVGAGAESQWPLGYNAKDAAAEVSKLSPRP